MHICSGLSHSTSAYIVASVQGNRGIAVCFVGQLITRILKVSHAHTAQVMPLCNWVKKFAKCCWTVEALFGPLLSYMTLKITL